MANQPHKRGFMYIYKGGRGNQRKNNELEPAVEGDNKHNSRSWLHRISRTRNSNNVGNANGCRSIDILASPAAGVGGGEGEGKSVESIKSTSCLVLESKGGGFMEGRKSVSCIEGAIASPAARGRMIVEEGRKSVSHIEENFAASKEGGGIVEARKSVSQIETLSSVIAYLQVKVLVSDMPTFMQVHAFRCARRTFDSLEKFSAKHIAHDIKKEFDKAYGPVWHCIVGSSFGSFVTHSKGCFLYFSMENLYILLFKTKIKKASD